MQLQALCGLSIVIVNDATKHVSTPNRTLPSTARVSCGDPLLDALMGSSMVEILDILLEHTLKMPLVHNEQMVEALRAYRANPPLCKRVTLRRQQHLVVLQSHNSSK